MESSSMSFKLYRIEWRLLSYSRLFCGYCYSKEGYIYSVTSGYLLSILYSGKFNLLQRLEYKFDLYGHFCKMDFNSPVSHPSYKSIKNIHCNTTFPITFQNITWSIQNFSFCTTKYGEKIESSIFYTGSEGQKWNLEIYPNGFSYDWNGMVSVLIKSYNHSSVSVKYIISIINKEKEKKNVLSGTYKFKNCYECAGFKSFIRRDELFVLDDLLPNDCLTLSCELYILGQIVNQESSYYHKPLESNLPRDLMNLFRSAEHSDITISIGPKEFRVHKAILAARSPVFSAMFKYEMEEKTSNNILIDDIDPQVMEEVLSYIYSGNCNRLHEMAHDIVRVADKYDIGDLKEECEQFLCSFVTLDNALLYMIIADMHNLQRLKSKIIKLLGPIYSNVTPEFIQQLCGQRINNNRKNIRYIEKFLSFIMASLYKALILELFYNP